MKIIPAYMHGVFDYLAGMLLLMAPNIFGFDDAGSSAVLIPRLLGILLLAQALLTDYEVGLFKVIPMKMHLGADYVASLFLAISPFILGFANQPPHAWMPHVAGGLLIFCVSLMTEQFSRGHRTLA